jgi:hypothetical protein
MTEVVSLPEECVTKLCWGSEANSALPFGRSFPLEKSQWYPLNGNTTVYIVAEEGNLPLSETESHLSYSGLLLTAHESKFFESQNEDYSI